MGASAQRVRGPAAHVAHRRRKQPIGTQQLAAQKACALPMLRLLNFRCSFCSNPLDETHGRDRLVQARQEAPGVEGVSGRLHRVEERQEMTAATAPGAARGRAREGASRRKELEDDHDQEH